VGDPVVSVVMAVYNMAEYLDECLTSIWEQSIGVEHLEVIAVDDGSDDGSLDRLDDWAADHPQLLVVRGPRTGAPGGPRNRGLELSRGEYVFFADPDDYLGAEALERMVDAAERYGSDLVMGRLRGVGRGAPVLPFMRSVGGGDVVSTHAVWTLTAHKLFSRELLVRHGLRFAEGARLAEEQPLVVPALFLASSISVVADYDCYYLVNRDGGEHLTQQTADPATFLPIVRSSLDTVIAHVDAGPVRDDLMRRWVSVEISRKFGARFATLPDAIQAAFLEGAREILDDLVPDRVDLLLPLDRRLRVACVRRGATAHLHALGVFEKEGVIGAPVYADGRVLAPWPGLRDPQWGVPDAYYDVAHALVPELAAVSVHSDGRWRLDVHVRPATPAGRDSAAEWEVMLCRGDEEHRVPVIGGVARIDLQAVDPVPGRWALVLAARTVDEEEAVHPVGDHGASCAAPDGSSGLVGAALTRSARGALRLDVRADVPTRPVLTTTGIRWHRGRLAVALAAPDARGDAVLELRSGGRTVRVPLVRSNGELRATFVPGGVLPPGRWSLWVGSRHQECEQTARVRLDPSAGERSWHPGGGQVARLSSPGERDWARIEVIGRQRWARRLVGRLVRPLRPPRGGTTA